MRRERDIQRQSYTEMGREKKERQNLMIQTRRHRKMRKIREQSSRKREWEKERERER